VTIVGLEKMKGGSYNLLVLDPMFRPSKEIVLLLGGNQHLSKEPGKLLNAYRRGESYLRRYNKFELLK
jgi:zinc finger-containing ubiquitin peptidase 1